MMSTQASRRADAERKASQVTVSDHGATDTIHAAAARHGVIEGILRWDDSAAVYRINDPYTWADVDFIA